MAVTASAPVNNTTRHLSNGLACPLDAVKWTTAAADPTTSAEHISARAAPQVAGGRVQLPAATAPYVAHLTSQKQRSKYFKLGLNWTRWSERAARARRFENALRAHLLTIEGKASAVPPSTVSTRKRRGCASAAPSSSDLVLTIGDYTDNVRAGRAIRAPRHRRESIEPRAPSEPCGSLREAGAACDAVLFTNNNSSELATILVRYRARRQAYSVVEDAKEGGWPDVRIPSDARRTLLEGGPVRRQGRVVSARVSVATLAPQICRVRPARWNLGVLRRKHALCSPFASISRCGLTAFTETAAISLHEKKHVYFSKTWPKKS
eukprot:501375-Prymnesium_polylepis.1